MSARHHFSAEASSKTVLARACAHCGLRRRYVVRAGYPWQSHQLEALYQLPGRSAWTTEKTACGAGKVKGRR